MTQNNFDPIGNQALIATADLADHLITANKESNDAFVSVATATTPDIGAVNSRYINFTGTVTVTGFATAAAGLVRHCKAAGAFLLTFNAVSLITQTSASITTVAGDTFDLISLGSGNWLQANYARFNGTALVSTVSTVPVPVRQTVLSGPLDSNGFSAFGGSTGATTVTAAGTLIATAANGWALTGQVDRVGSITNPSWAGLSTNGAMYLFLDIAADGSCTTAASTVAPVYEFGGSPAVTSGTFTFNIQQSVGFLGNGATAPQSYRVAVGEVTVTGSVVTAITWYALCGRFESAYANTLPGAGVLTNYNHNIGVQDLTVHMDIKNLSPENGYLAGDVVTQPLATVAPGVAAPVSTGYTTNVCWFTTGGTDNITVVNKTTGADVVVADNKWSFRMTAFRNWGGS